MSREIDERIVAMYFDDKNFSSGAQQAIKTLDELKKSCNMEGVGKGLETFSDVTKKMNLDDLRKKTNNVKSAFESLGGVMKKVFGAALSPIQSVKHEIDNLNGYIGKVFGIDLASKIVGSLENVFRSLTVAPISAGWGQYENTMDSIKTIMSSTGENIDTVKGKLAEMTEYANQTIYSLNDMTSNLGKFTNNGVKLNDATNAMIGLANATADAGQGAQQASMAMYNVSQAIGVGKMTTIDWKSLENANIATKKLKQTFIDAAVAHGTLTKKVEKDKQTGEEVVKYFTKAEKGSKSVEVSVENFRETLNKGWLDKTSMMNTFSIFSGQLTADEIAALGFSKEESARLYQIGQEAMAAATEVRTFSKMMDALKESVQSGWAASFEYIFGDMEEGTNLWTTINDKIDGILSKSTENRNNILMSWRGLMKDEDGQIRKIRDVYENRKQALFLDYDAGRISAERYAEELQKLEDSLGDKRLWIDYREIAIETFNNIFDIFTNIGGAVKGAWTDVFGEFNADTLKNITQRIREVVDAVKTWLGSSDDADSRISKIRKGLSGVFNVLKIGINIVKSVVEVGWNVIKPCIDPLLDLCSKFGEWLNLGETKNIGDMIKSLTDKFKTFWGTLTKLGWKGALDKIGEWLSGIWQNIKSGVRTWLTDNGLDGVVEWFESIGQKIEEGFNAVKEWWASTGIGDFIADMWETITGWFKPKEITRYNGSMLETTYEDPPIVMFFKTLGSKIESAYNSFTEWFAKSGIPDFFASIWESVTGLFKGEEVTRYNGSMLETRYEDPPIVTFFKTLGSKIESAYNNLKSWWEGESGIPEFFSSIWESVTGIFKGKEVTRYNGSMLETTYEKAPIITFFENLRRDIETVWGRVSKWEGWAEIGKFFSDTWNWIIGKSGETSVPAEGAGGNKDESAAANTEEKVGFVQRILDTLSGFWESATGWIKEIGGGELAERFLSAVTKILEVVAVITEHLVNLVHGALVKGDIGSIIELITAIGGILTIKWFQSRNTKNLATISENTSSIGTTMLQMAGAIALISLAVSVIGKIPIGQLVQGLVGVVVIATALFFVTKQLTALSVARGGDEPVKAWERVLSKLVTIGGAALMLETLVSGLPAIIDAIAKAKQFSDISGDDIMKTLLGAAGVIAGIMIALAAVERIVPGGISPIAAVKTVIAVVGSIVVAGGLLLGAGGLLELLGSTPEDIKAKMARVTAFLEGFGDSLNGLLRGLLGVTHAEALQEAHAERSQNNTKNLLSFLSELTEGFDTSQLSTLINFMSTITEMTKMSEGFDSAKLVHFSGTIEYLVDGLLKFVKIFTGKYQYVQNADGSWSMEWLDGFTKRGTEDYERLMTAIDIIRQFYDAFNPQLLNLRTEQMKNWQDYFAEAGTMDKIVENMNAIIDSAANLHDASGIQFDGIAIVTKFYDSINEAFQLSNGTVEVPKFDASPIVQAIVDALDIGNVTIKEAVKRMIQSGMDLVETEGVEIGNLGNVLDWESLLGTSNPEEKATELVNTITESMGGVEGDIDKTVKGLNIKISGVTIDESFMTDLQSQWEALQAEMDGTDMDELQITVKPILDTTDFDEQYASFSELFSGNMPVSMGAVINIGDQPIPINDTNIINEIRMLRYDLQSVSANLQSVIYNVDGSLANHIDGVTNAVRNIRIPSARATLREIDEGLYRSALNSALTGVSAYAEP